MRLHKDDLGNVVQAVGLGVSGSTTNIVTVAASCAISSVALDGLYRITSNVDVHLAVGSAATNDEPLWANTETHKYINNKKLAAFCDVSSGIVSATLCP